MARPRTAALRGTRMGSSFVFVFVCPASVKAFEVPSRIWHLNRARIFGSVRETMQNPRRKKETVRIPTLVTQIYPWRPLRRGGGAITGRARSSSACLYQVQRAPPAPPGGEADAQTSRRPLQRYTRSAQRLGQAAQATRRPAAKRGVQCITPSVEHATRATCTAPTLGRQVHPSGLRQVLRDRRRQSGARGRGACRRALAREGARVQQGELLQSRRQRAQPFYVVAGALGGAQLRESSYSFMPGNAQA